MNSTCYGYYSSDSVLTGSNRTSISSNENVLSVHCGPKMISSYISFGSEQSSNSRLDMLQQIANRVQRDSLGCEDKLILARSALQVDTKRMESGIQFQNDSEIAGYLIECENLLRQQLVDVQTLVDGQYYQADQLVQRVASLRDELLALRNEYSSLYSKGRMLSSDQTQLMISGISQSLNSGFSQSLNPAMNSSVSHNMAPMSPTNLTPGISTNFAQGMAANLNQGVSGSLSPALQPVHTPGLPSSLNASYSQGFNSQLTPAMTPGFAPGFNQGLIQNYATGMNTNPLQSLKLMQVKKPLLKSSFADQNLPEEEVNLKFVQDLCSWVEEMQIQLDRGNWGSELSSIEFHLENHKHFHGGIEEFETSLKEAKMTELQISGPLKSSYSDTLHKVEGLYSKLLSSSRNRHKHLDALHSFVARATRELIWLNEKEEEEVAYDWSDRNQNISAKKDYHADLMRELDHKEEVIKSLQDTAEQMLLQNHPARSTIEAYKAAMQTQWNWILQLCSCVEQHIRQNTAYFEITIYKDDECVLGSNSHRGKWKVISPTGNEAMVPSVCFTVPAPNKEAIDAANRIEQMYQSVLSLWHESHINMKSMVSWHYLMSEIEAMRASKVSSIKTLLPGEHQQVMGNLKTRFEEFLEDSQESKMFSVSDISQLEREVNVCKLYYEELLKSAEREEQEESIYNLYTSEIRNFRLRLESIEERLIRQIRTPLDRDDLHESALRISEQEKVKKELDHLKVDLSAISEKCEEFFSQAAASPSIGALQGELNAVIQYMNTLYSMSSIYLEKLKTINLVLKNTQGAETLVKTYETKLCEEDVITADKVAIDRLVATLKQWRSEVDEKREVFHALEDGLQKAKAISDQMFKVHKERDLDFDWHKEKADQIAERWQNVHSQIENRLRDLDGISKSLKYYKESYLTLDSWIRQIEETQSKLQDSMSDSKALSKQLDQQKMLISEIEMKQSKVDECQKYSEQYSLAIKDYELQLMTYRALVDSHQKSPMKRRRFQSSSDVVVQEYMDLKTRYNALMTLINQFIKFSGETLKRLEEEEILMYSERSSMSAYPELLEQQKSSTEENKRLLKRIQELELALEEVKKQKFMLEQDLPKIKAAAEMEIKKHQKAVEDLTLQKTKSEYEAQQFRLELETTVKLKTAAEQQLEHVRQMTKQAESKRDAVEDKLRAFKSQIEESTTARRKLEEHLKRKEIDLQDLESKKTSLMTELKRKAEIEDELMRQIKHLESDLIYQKKIVGEKIEYETKRQYSDSLFSFSSSKDMVIPARTVQEVQYMIDSDIRGAQAEQYIKKAETLKQQLDELTLVHKKAEIEIKQYKSELSTLQIQRAAADEKSRQLRNQLDDTHNILQQLKMELEQKNQLEQNYVLQIREVERKLYQSQDKADDVMQEANELKKIRMSFEEELKLLQQEKVSLNHKLKMQKADYDDVREKLKACQDELRQKDMSERGSLQKISFLEEDLARKKQEVDDLRKRMEELSRAHAKSESSLKMLNTQMTSLQQEKTVIEQRSQSRSGEVDSLRDQLKKVQEEFNQNARAHKEDQQKIMKLQDELAKSNQWSNSLKLKLDELTKLNNENEMMLRKLKSESEKTTMERNNLQKNLDMSKSQLESTKEQIRVTHEQLQKQSKGEYETQNMVKRLEEELSKSKNALNEIKQKFDKQSLTILNYEKDIRNLKTEINSLSVEKRMVDQKIQQHQSQLLEVNTKLKKAQDDLHKKTVDEQLAHKKLALYQEESSKYKNTAEEFRMKLEKTVESNLSTENQFSNLRLEVVSLKQEKAMLDEKFKLLKAELSEVRERLQRSQDQLNIEKKSGLDHAQKCRKLEEELDNQKRTVESLRQKVDLQRQDHINQLRYLQNEIQQNSSNSSLRSPLQKSDYDMKGNSFAFSSSSQQDFDILSQRAKSSPVLRRKLDGHLEVSSPVYNSTLIEEKKKQVDGYDETVQKELQLQLSRIKQSLDSGEKAQPFEYVTQTSTELQISIDNMNPYRQLSELETIKDKSIQNAIQTLRIEEEKIGKELGKFDQSMEIVKSKQYDLTVEVTTVKQEKEFLINNEDQVFEERNILEGFRRSDLPKMGYMSSSYKSYAGSETSLSDSSSTDDRFIFQGLRKNVSAKQLVEARILDGKTMEQLESGRMTIQEVQKALDTYLTKATAIAGLYLEASREKISFSLAAKKGIIDKGLAFEFLEAQAVTGFIIDPSTGKKYSVEEAITSGFADQEFKEKLLEAEKAVIGYIHSGKRLSVFQAIEARLLERQKGKRILEAQITTGGVIDPIRSVRIPAEVAVLKGLLNHTTLKFLHEPASNVKGFHFPTNKQSMYYSELLQLCVLDLNSQTFLLPIGERNISAFSAEKGHKICIVDTRSSIELTRFEAYERGLIDQRSYLELSQYECQWETATVFDSQGKSQTHLIDRKTGRQFSLEEAVSQGKIDRSQIGKIKDGQISATELADIIVSRTRPAKDPNSPLAGFWILETSERVSAFKALKRNMVDRVTVFRCLEAQASTGGILDPSNGKKHSVSEALQKGLIDEVCAKQIQQFELAYTGVIQHSTKALLSAFEATNVNLLNKEIGSRSLEYQYLTGGLIDPKTHARLSLEDAIRKGIVDAATATKLKDEKSYVKNLTCPKSRRKISYKDALETAVFDCHTGFRLMKAPLPKLLEEEKKEHVKNAGDILNWVSKINKTLSKEGGSQDTAEKKQFSEPQVLENNMLHLQLKSPQYFISYFSCNKK
ncbi:hypothetical protein AB205_0203350 [Aquarana catesbeiana]|uniref:Dystonin n=2 Tax=Aquarana catesbeiana TaxID=8400 RepID=A0A2G9S940_AQUCT|nr:hypothetical protein AB205_0203350 [Aquarana catesbeiana]